MRRSLIVFTTALLLAGCVHPLGKQSSGIEAPSRWSRLTGRQDADTPLVADNAAAIDQIWWKNFNDPTLDKLVDEALTNNKTLAIAKARVEEARANSRIVNSRLYPQLDATASLNRGNQGFTTNDRAVNLGEVGLQASWEVDLFGGNRARSQQAEAVFQSQQASQDAVRVTLLADVARAYFDMRNSERQIAITRENLDTQRRTLDLIRAQQAGALASELDVQRAGAQVSTTEAQLPMLQAAYDAALNRLSVLLGSAPGTKDILLSEKQILKPLDARIVVGAPATVLANRPDIQAAERRFAASISASKAARTDLFPKIGLLTFFGVQDSSVISSSPWSIGASLTQPILNFSRIESQIDAADARQKQALLDYQQTVLLALEDMENSLTNYAHEDSANHSLDMAVQQNRKSVDLAKLQFTNGFAGLLDVLVAQRDLLRSESDSANSDTRLRKNLVAIYAAAGGGWSE